MVTFIPWLAFLTGPTAQVPDLSNVKIGVGPDCAKPAHVFRVQIVRTPASLERGLGFRKKPLAKDEGMLFMFDPPQPAVFWMKDTFIPLSIAFFDEKGKLVSTYEMPVDKNPSNPKERYGGTKAVATAVELAPKVAHAFKVGKDQICMPGK